MSIIGIDIGSTTVKIIEYKDKKITNSKISTNRNKAQEVLEKFIEDNKIEIHQIEKIVITGIGADKIKNNPYHIPMEKVKEFTAIGTGGLYLTQKEKAIIASVGTGTALIRAEKGEFKHLGGTGVGAGTLTNLCKQFVGVKSFDEIIELSKQGTLSNIDLVIADLTDEKIETLPPDLTLANFGKLKGNESKADIVVGLINMVFETIGMMTAFASRNDSIKDIVLIGNITSIPVIKDMLKKIERTHKINFTIPENPQFAVAIGAIESLKSKP